MLEEIILLRLEFALRAWHEIAPFAYLPFVPVCQGMAFKQSRSRH